MTVLGYGIRYNAKQSYITFLYVLLLYRYCSYTLVLFKNTGDTGDMVGDGTGDIGGIGNTIKYSKTHAARKRVLPHPHFLQRETGINNFD